MWYFLIGIFWKWVKLMKRFVVIERLVLFKLLVVMGKFKKFKVLMYVMLYLFFYCKSE